MINKDFTTITKVVGVTKFNENNYPIQMILQNLCHGDKLVFIRDYSNPYDENAIKVYAWCEKQLTHIGYISKELTANLSPFLDDNSDLDLDGIVKEITGGYDGKSYGCNIEIWINNPNEPDYWEAKAFADWMVNQTYTSVNESSTPQKTSNESYDSTYNNYKNEKAIKENRSILIISCIIVFLLVMVLMQIILNINDSETYDISSPNLSNSNQNNYDNTYSDYSSTTSNYKPPITMENIDIAYNILPPNLINTVYVEATYTNNSSLTITNFSLKILLRDKNDTSYLSCSDTVLPGGTSYKFKTFGPNTQLYEDVEFLKCSLTVMDPHKGEIHIDYDYKLDTYETW
ncbi:MAG: hypothetical protein E7561_05230 [Ruminococcaceae bacterium]|nr:hypothetical protein [Oscillospiraceae bacterium]